MAPARLKPSVFSSSFEILLGSPLACVEHQTIHREHHVNVGESGVRQRLLLSCSVHVERDTSRRVVERSVVADQDESGDGEDLVELLVQSWCVSLVPQLVNSLQGGDTVKTTFDAARPVLGSEAGEHKGGCM